MKWKEKKRKRKRKARKKRREKQKKRIIPPPPPWRAAARVSPTLKMKNGKQNRRTDEKACFIRKEMLPSLYSFDNYIKNTLFIIHHPASTSRIGFLLSSLPHLSAVHTHFLVLCLLCLITPSLHHHITSSLYPLIITASSLHHITPSHQNIISYHITSSPPPCVCAATAVRVCVPTLLRKKDWQSSAVWQHVGTTEGERMDSKTKED